MLVWAGILNSIGIICGFLIGGVVLGNIVVGFIVRFVYKIIIIINGNF